MTTFSINEMMVLKRLHNKHSFDLSDKVLSSASASLIKKGQTLGRERKRKLVLSRGYRSSKDCSSSSRSTINSGFRTRRREFTVFSFGSFWYRTGCILEIKVDTLQFGERQECQRVKIFSFESSHHVLHKLLSKQLSWLLCVVWSDMKVFVNNCVLFISHCFLLQVK